MQDELYSYGILAKIAELGEQKKINVSKDKLQKLVFLMSELARVETGYRFQFFTYGPFSSSLAGDIDYLSHIGVLEGAQADSAAIGVGKKAGRVKELAGEKLKSQEHAIYKIVDSFGDLSPRQLELLATLVYINRYDPLASRDICTLVSKTKELKPTLSDSVIEEGIHSLARTGYMPATTAC